MKQITIAELQFLADYFVENRHRIDIILADFGEVSYDNGYGTLFLKPSNTLFKVFWIFCKNRTVEVVGFGGSNLGLFLQDLCSVYRHHTEGFSIYDEEFVYVFYSDQNYRYTVKITSPIPLFENGIIIDNATVDLLEIRLTESNQLSP